MVLGVSQYSDKTEVRPFLNKVRAHNRPVNEFRPPHSVPLFSQCYRAIPTPNFERF